jgi:hypothetical protein
LKSKSNKTVRREWKDHTIGHVHLYELEILKSDSLLFIKWVHYIHLFLLQKLFPLKHKTHPNSETMKTNTPKFKNNENKHTQIQKQEQQNQRNQKHRKQSKDIVPERYPNSETINTETPKILCWKHTGERMTRNWQPCLDQR